MATTTRSQTVIRSLPDYEIDSIRGFLPPQDPLMQLPTAFQVWEELGQELPKLLVSHHLRNKINSMPLLSIDSLTSRMEIERAMMILSYLGHAYVWGERTPALILPKSLAVPWSTLASKLGRPPVLSYASYALYNWKRIDPLGPIECGNIALLQNFLGGIDEEWFILIHVDIEAKAAPILSGIAEAQAASVQDQPDKACAALEKIGQGIAALYATLERMPEHCDPYIYYNRVRPYIHGWKNHPLTPQGIIYEGVNAFSGKPQQFRGETGAQSSIVPSLDGALDVGHKDDPLRPYLLEMQDYMPAKHRAFIKACEQGPSLREYVTANKETNQKMRAAYNSCIDWLEKFRALHLTYAVNYIFKQAEQSASNPSKVGTGGTPFVDYLKKHRDETGQHRI